MIETINKLYEEDPRFDSLRGPGIRFVPGCGPMRPDIMLVGEAPGALENAKQIPFQGMAGKFLWQLLEGINRNVDDIYVTNAVKYWPTDESGNTRPPTEAELRASASYLLQEIEAVKPKIIGLCGHSAIRAVFPYVKNVNEVHYQLLADKFVPLYHPAQMGYKPLMSGKMLKGYKMLNEYLIQKVG